MTYKEFKKVISEIASKYDLNLNVTEDMKNIYVKVDDAICAQANKIMPCFMNTDTGGLYYLSEEARLEILEALYKLSRTPIDERRKDMEYYLKHRFLIDGYGDAFLTHTKSDDAWFLSDEGHFGNYQTQFTQDEIDEIKKKYNTDLKDFEIIEVDGK